MTIAPCRKLVSLAICLPLTLSPTFAAPPDTVQDDTLSPAACEAVGIKPQDNRRADMRMLRAPLSMIAPRAAPPPSAEQITVSGARIASPAFQSPSAAYPLQDREKYPHATPNPVKQVAQEPVSTFSIDVDTAAYANVRRFLKDGHLPPHDAVRVEEMVNYFNYGYPLPAQASEPFHITTAMAPSPWSRHKILHIGVQGFDIPRAQQPPMNLVFLMDTSGSMEEPDRLPLARKSLNILVSQLRPQDHVALVAYAGSAGAVLGSTSGDQKLKIRCALQTLESGGSTAGGEGLALAYALEKQNFRKDAVNRIILMTDGDFNVGISDPEKLKDFVAEKRKTGIYLSVYGFGRGNYQDAMMQALAQTGNGTASYIDTLDEARKLFQDDLSGSIFPIADDVKIQVEFNPRVVKEYRLIGYETRLLNREDFNNDQVDAGEVGSRASVTALYELTMAGDKPSSDPLRYVSDTPPAAGSGELGYLKLRYKMPGQKNSKLMQAPISTEAAPTLAAAPEATRWAIAVAGFGEKLRGSPWIDRSFGWPQVESLAQGARGTDTFGLRAEFTRLVHSAKDARSVNE
jgi:Ca-activated chloride channel homolog